jgi:hypothetical protein
MARLRRFFHGERSYTPAEELDHMIPFVPNILLRHFRNNVHPSQYSNFNEASADIRSTSVRAAVLLADISGFSKFAARMCSLGVQGLNDLHDATSDLFGHFISKIYSHGGDGK